MLLYCKLQNDEPMSAIDPMILGSQYMDVARIPVIKQEQSTLDLEEKEGTMKKGLRTPQPPLDDDDDDPIAGLVCKNHGGPDDEAASEMNYWSDIPSDSTFVSPFYDPGTEKYLTFEADIGGWNNVRMSYETTILLAHAMGRTLVLPPKKG